MKLCNFCGNEFITSNEDFAYCGCCEDEMQIFNTSESGCTARDVLDFYGKISWDLPQKLKVIQAILETCDCDSDKLVAIREIIYSKEGKNG
jgi:hypothetical protein